MKKTLRKTPDFPRCSAERKRGHIKATSSFERPSRWHFCFSLISMHHNGFTKSFACCLSCESCLCAQCQMPGQGRGDVGRGRRGGGGGQHPSLPRPWSFLIFTVTRCKLCSKPPQERAEPGKNNLLFDQLFKKKKKERKETASLSADSLFNQLHKKCTEKIRTILYRYMWPALLRKLLSNEETLNNAVL